MVVLVALAARAEGYEDRNDDRDLAVCQLGRQPWQLIIFPLCPSILDRHILAFDETG
jgi:hypothetical protein